MSGKLAENSTTQHKSLKLRIYPTEEQSQLIIEPLITKVTRFLLH